MEKQHMQNFLFEQLLATLNQETGSCETKLQILFNSRGFFSPLQASRILYAFGSPSDKVRAIKILEPRLCRMSCNEARDIIGSVSIQNDKLQVLQAVKRYLVDYRTREGRDCILSCFPFEHDKVQAVYILETVRSDVADSPSAGGHQGYAALGGLFTQSRPLEPHVYGPVTEQMKWKPGRGKIEIPVTAKTGLFPSIYNSHPSYLPPPGRDYATENGYPINDMYEDEKRPPVQCGEYPRGAPPLGMHQGGPAPMRFM